MTMRWYVIHVYSGFEKKVATSIREQAEQEAATLRKEADEYVFGVLCQLEEELRRTLRVVENGLRKLQKTKDE